MLERRDPAPFRAVVGLLRSYLNDTGNRLTIDARLAYAGHAGRAGQGFEVIPGLSLRFALAAIYEALSEGKDDAALYALDQRLGLAEVDEPAGDWRLAPEVPTSTHDPAAMAALAALGEATYE